ncbi:MAG: beta-ketoacyl synthase, partial [Spongiibacteraceae bacterium]
LAAVMGLDIPSDQPVSAEQKRHMREHTLIRKIEDAAFDVEKVAWNKRMAVSGDNDDWQFVTRTRDLPDPLPENWTVTSLSEGQARVTIRGDVNCLLPTSRKFEVSSAGQLPTGFDPAEHYPARSHPRGLQMTICGVSDALRSMGIDWQTVSDAVGPDNIGVYASSAMAQLDDNGFGGLLGSRANGGRVSSKQLALGLADMPADFISAYVLGNIGVTGPSLGACATYFYNMRQAVQDIRNGTVRVAVVGAAESGVHPLAMDGYMAMGALATDAELLKLDSGLVVPDYSRASRPFSSNCGFTISESAQFTILFDDALALELGAQIHGSVPDVFVNADGFKKSISGPGVGNYLTVAKAVSSAASILGDEAVRHRSYVQAHGTSTPQNRVSESHILNETAKWFGIEKWPVAALKAYLGHSVGAASGDQFNACLGVWNDNVIPGIATIDHIADDVYDSNLLLQREHIPVEDDGIDISILNAKGFGGNNASVTVLSPDVTRRLLRGRHGEKAWTDYQRKVEVVAENAAAYDAKASISNPEAIYHFGSNVLEGADLALSRDGIAVKGWKQRVSLPTMSPYRSWLEEK